MAYLPHLTNLTHPKIQKPRDLLPKTEEFDWCVVKVSAHPWGRAFMLADRVLQALLSRSNSNNEGKMEDLWLWNGDLVAAGEHDSRCAMPFTRRLPDTPRPVSTAFPISDVRRIRLR